MSNFECAILSECMFYNQSFVKYCHFFFLQLRQYTKALFIVERLFKIVEPLGECFSLNIILTGPCSTVLSTSLLFHFTCMTKLCYPTVHTVIHNLCHIMLNILCCCLTEETLGCKICFLLSEIYLTLYKVTF